MQPLTKGRYSARLAVTKADLSSALALRHLCFRAARGQRQTASDADPFDARCQHMLVCDTVTGDLVCCYRLMSFANGRATAAGYAAQFYDLTPLAAIDAPVIELGRFCLLPDRSDPDILRLAWAALTRLVDAQGAAMLFGCSSFVGADPAAHAAALGHLARHHLAPSDLSPGVRAVEAVALAAFAQPTPDRLPALPPLLRTYLGMGGWVSDHAVIDRDLDTLHVFTGLSIAAIPPHRAAALRALAADVPG
jgi:L-ornithine Nalpha-acyltransferase